jgi:hypothetical protein
MMSYRVTGGAQRPQIVLTGEPAHCRALDAAPPAREPALDAGTWLVMAFAIWSVPDQKAIQVALDAAQRFGGKLKLGLRPYHDPQELDTWYPGREDDGRSPLWLLLDDGKVRMRRSGPVTVDELVKAIRAACPALAAG